MGQGQEGRRDYQGIRKLLEMMDIFIILIVVMVSWCKYMSELLKIVRLDYVLFIVCHFYLNKAVKETKRLWVC